jgi:hypothetical protein
LRADNRRHEQNNADEKTNCERSEEFHTSAFTKAITRGQLAREPGLAGNLKAGVILDVLSGCVTLQLACQGVTGHSSLDIVS